MMETLGTEPGSIIEVKNVTLPLGSFVKIQPQSTDFLDISDHRAVYVSPYSIFMRNTKLIS